MIAAFIIFLIELVGLISIACGIFVYFSYSSGLFLNIEKEALGFQFKISGTKGKELSLTVKKK